MSPLAAEERARRLAPLATGAAALAVALVPRALAGTSSAATRGELTAAALVAVAAGLLAHAVAAARGAAGVVAGTVAGLWLAAAAAASAGDAGATTSATALALAAGLVAVLARAAVDRAMLPATPTLATTPAAVALAVVEPRAWALVAVIAALVAVRERGRRRWLAAAPALAAMGAGIVSLLAALGDAPSWASSVAAPARAEVWLRDGVDGLGPVALVLAAVGLAAAAGERRGRWALAGMAGALATLVPLAARPAPGAGMVGVATAIGVAMAVVGSRAGRLRQQVLVATAVAVVLVAPLVM
jgi:hypothetical protein